MVTADALNIREGADISSAISCDRDPATLGAILRVFGEQNGWLQISSSKYQWVYGRYTRDVKRAVVNTDSLNIRTGPGTNYPATTTFNKGHEVFIEKESGNWAKVSMDDKWMSKTYLDFSN